MILGLVLLLVIWVAVSMVDGCPVPHGGDNVRSGSSGHSRGYYHGGKY